MILPNSIRKVLQVRRDGGAGGATQRALAEKLGIPEANMSRIVSGEMLPSRQQVEIVAEFLKCQPVPDLYNATTYQALQTLWDEAAAAAQASG